MNLGRWILALTLLLGCAEAAMAQQSKAPVFHVFGGWAYGKTDGNNYLAGTHAGSFDNASLALNVSDAPLENLRLEGQLFVARDQGTNELLIDFAFAEWRISDALRLRAGKIKHPFGIYNEVYEVGTLRPFFALPQSEYGPVGVLAEGYSGVGVSGTRRMGSSWSLQYDAYFGSLNLPFNDFNVEGHRGAREQHDLNVKEVLGGRVVFDTPVEGLSFGGSAYRGKIAAGAVTLRHSAGGMQFEYLTDRISLRTEWTRVETGDDTEHAAYVESAYRFTPHWQGAARYDFLRENDARSDLGRHREKALGINYWFTPQFVLKLSAHEIDGLHLSHADAGTSAVKPKTRLLMFGAQFSF